jgi:hypothetical protein
MIDRNNFIVPISQEVKGQAEFILASTSLQFIKPKFYQIDEATVAEENSPEVQSNFVKGNLNGLPVFDSIVLKKTGGTATIGADDLIMVTALISANKPRNIVLTKIQGRNGTVKEYVSDDDYQINIKGVIVGKYANKRPIEELKKLEDFCNEQAELNVISNFINDLGVNTIVITGHTINQRESMRNVIDFEISCLSEEPFEIKSNA